MDHSSSPEGHQAEIAIIGGSGLYDTADTAVDDIKEIKVYTPYGRPSEITIGCYKDRKIAFLPRHGKGHQYPAHLVNYRANIWALKQLGVQRIFASNSCGSLQQNLKPGELVIIDQFIDCSRRAATFYEGGKICHISTADPFCEELRKLLIETSKKLKLPIHEKGTYICVEGPRFSTRAESRLFRQWGADVIGMTLVPECVLAREAQICYASIALVTDYDVWAEKPVDFQEIVDTMAKNIDKTKKLVFSAIEKMPERSCECAHALDNAVF